MKGNTRKVGDLTVHVIKPENHSNSDNSPEDRDMDVRVSAAVKEAIKKAKVCNNPIAKYDARRKKAYVEQNGVKNYVE